jgi:dipeptidyl aminopeptidase/acylaminoacyl peptidase
MEARQLKTRYAVALIVLLFLSTAPTLAADKRPMTLENVMAIKAVGSAVISPDSRSVIYTVHEWELNSKDKAKPGKMESRTHLWLVSTSVGSDDGLARQITYGEKGESSPAWSPDGRHISFLANRGKAASDEETETQIWIMPSDGGEAWQLTESKESVSAYAWSPDSRQIAYIAQDPWPDGVEQSHKRGDDARVYEGDFRATRLWVIDVASRQAVMLTAGQDLTITEKPSWSPNGKQIAFSAKPTPMIRDTRSDVYVLTVASKSLEKITTNLGPDSAPLWSPDGTMIAFISTPNDGAPDADGIPVWALVNSHLKIFHVDTGQTEDAGDLGSYLAGVSLLWTANSKHILFHTGHRVYNEVFSYDLAEHRARQLTEERNINFDGAGAMSRDGSKIAFTMQTSQSPSEVDWTDASFSIFHKLTNTNSQLEGFRLGKTEVLEWKSSDGTPVEGLLLQPTDFQLGKRYPLLTVVHGGPTGAYTNGFQAEGQFWAGQGWAVLYPNPRGSTNYGEKFMRANLDDWGGGDYRDIVAGVDAVVQRGLADPNRLAEWGWSYGGYMTCWIVSQTSRFKAAMMGAGLSDLNSMYGTTDIPNYIALFFHGRPSEETLPLYRERSGLTYADRVTTPLLILEGGSDERVPIGQPMEFFRALKERGRMVQLVFYPREGHGFREYYHQLDRMRRTYEWITKYTLQAPSGQSPTGPAR